MGKTSGSIHLKVQVWIHCGSEVLLFQTNAQRGAFWQPITGSVEPNETVEAAALRELKEESGFEPGIPPRPLGFEFEFRGSQGPCRESCFEVKLEGKRPEPILDPKEHQAFRWVSAAEAEKMLKFESNQMALKILLKRLK